MMIRGSAKTVFFLFLMAGGCAQIKHQQHIDEATHRWNHMRAKIKLQMAERTYENGHLDRALDVCAEAIGLDREYSEAYHLMARIRLERGEVAMAEAALDASDTLPTMDTETAYLRGLIAERRGRLKEAALFYEEAYEANPHELDYLLTFVEALIGADRLEQAATVLLPRRVDFERQAEVHALAGQILTQLGRHDEAVDAYRIALDIESDNDLLREETAVALISADKTEEAVDLLASPGGSGTNRWSGGLYGALVAALLRNHHPERAATVLATALGEYPSDARLWLMLAETHLSLGNLPDAGYAASEAVHLAPEMPEAWLLLGYQALATSDTPKAASAARRILEENPNDLEARFLLARAAEADPDGLIDAIEQYEAILAIAPELEWARRELQALSQRAEANGDENHSE